MRNLDTRRRVLIGGAVLMVLTALAAFFAFLTRDHRTSGSPPDPVTSAEPSIAPAPDRPEAPEAELPEPPETDDPIEFAQAAAEALWAYDTRAVTHEQHMSALQAWMTGEKKYTDATSVAAQVPSPVLWAKMADNGQFATPKAGEAHFPMAFVEALREDPAAITEVYLYAVTVTGEPSIAWNGFQRRRRRGPFHRIGGQWDRLVARCLDRLVDGGTGCRGRGPRRTRG